MKNKLLFSAFLMASSLAFANNREVSSEKVTDVVQEKPAKTCYGRICETSSVEVSEGVTVEIKECSDWIEIPCDEDQSTAPVQSFA